MRSRILLQFLILTGLLNSNPAIAENSHISANQTRKAYGQPFSSLNTAEKEIFFKGRSLFHQSWVIAPAKDPLTGLGPLFNRISCASCHPKNGRGRAPDNPQERMMSMLVRLSVEGETSEGGPVPHPHYGLQLNEEGIPTVPGEGRAQVHWQYSLVSLADGTQIQLRKPTLKFVDLNYGPLDAVLSSPRIGPPVFGLGLLEAISDADLKQQAQRKKADGIVGKLNQVWDISSQQTRIGRFGAKANVASLRAQTAEALLGDLGITSPLLPKENCMPVQQECQQAPSGGTPELTRAQLDELEFYFRYLAVPARRNINDPQVIAGEKLFYNIGCAKCHKATWQTAPDHPHKALANLTINPYSDLLLHDMGEGLADDRPDFLANGREWRTAPLWGIGLTQLISEYQAYLHDGRARTLTEAILWHGGEADIVTNRYKSLSKSDRKFLENFLLSL